MYYRSYTPYEFKKEVYKMYLKLNDFDIWQN